MNAALGIAGVSLGLGGSILGIITVVIGLVKHQPQLVRMGRVYVVVIFAGAVLAFAAMERALITRDFSLAYVAEVGSRATPAAVQLRRAVERARGVDPAVGAGPHRLHGRRDVATSGGA